MKTKPEPKKNKKGGKKPLVCSDCGEEMYDTMHNYGEPEIGYNLCERCYEYQRIMEE